MVETFDDGIENYVGGLYFRGYFALGHSLESPSLQSPVPNCSTLEASSIRTEKRSFHLPWLFDQRKEPFSLSGHFVHFRLRSRHSQERTGLGLGTGEELLWEGRWDGAADPFASSLSSSTSSSSLTLLHARFPPSARPAAELFSFTFFLHWAKIHCVSSLHPSSLLVQKHLPLSVTYPPPRRSLLIPLTVVGYSPSE